MDPAVIRTPANVRVLMHGLHSCTVPCFTMPCQTACKARCTAFIICWQDSSKQGQHWKVSEAMPGQQQQQAHLSLLQVGPGRHVNQREPAGCTAHGADEDEDERCEAHALAGHA